MKNEYISQINNISNHSEHRFAAANTYKGFISFFDECFNAEKLKKIYILKGGPGCGKSTLMKKAALSAEKKGMHPIYYHCSSDPYSLDGVIINETGFAILDGTAPHTLDPVYAGAKGHILNLASAWDTELLSSKSTEIIALSKRKEKSYNAAYRLFSSAKSLKDELSDISSDCIDKQKMSLAASRFAKINFKKGNTPSTQYIIENALSSCGAVRFFNREKTAKNKFFIKDIKHTAYLFFEMLYERGMQCGANMVIGREALEPEKICSLYFPDASLSISLYDEDFCLSLDRAEIPYKIINLRRFFDTLQYKKSRAKYRFLEKCYDSILSAAISELSEAGRLHTELESIYSAATDYEKVSLSGAAIIKEACS